MKGAAALAFVACWLSGGAAWGAQISDRSGNIGTVELFQGGVAEIRLAAPRLAAAEGQWGGEKIYFYRGDGGGWSALIGADLQAKPGTAKILVRGATIAGASWSTEIPLRIKAKAFKKESFSVAQKFDEFSPEVLERIRRDREAFDGAFAVSGPQRLWTPPFVAPVPKEITSPFGYRRVINGAPRSPHSGVDLKAAMETPVVAANHGRVALVGDFFFSGKGVVLDHGGGLFTVYFHLADFKVEQGSEVKKGEVIALSGMSGRVTGPHLHWGARLNGARVDPFELIEKLGGGADGGTGSAAKKPEN